MLRTAVWESLTKKQLEAKGTMCKTIACLQVHHTLWLWITLLCHSSVEHSTRPKHRQKNTSSQTKPVISHHKRGEEKQNQLTHECKRYAFTVQELLVTLQTVLHKMHLQVFVDFFFFCKQISPGDEIKSTESLTNIKVKHSLIVMELSLPHILEAEILGVCVWVKTWQKLNTWKWRI